MSFSGLQSQLLAVEKEVQWGAERTHEEGASTTIGDAAWNIGSVEIVILSYSSPREINFASFSAISLHSALTVRQCPVLFLSSWSDCQKS